MRLHLELDGKVLEYTHRPMRSSRFRALCWLAAVGFYCGMVSTVANACGIPGLIVVGVVTFLCTALATT